MFFSISWFWEGKVLGLCIGYLWWFSVSLCSCIGCIFDGFFHVFLYWLLMDLLCIGFYLFIFHLCIGLICGFIILFIISFFSLVSYGVFCVFRSFILLIRFNKVRLSLIRLGEVCLFHYKYYFFYYYFFHWLVVGFSVCFACLFRF